MYFFSIRGQTKRVGWTGMTALLFTLKSESVISDDELELETPNLEFLFNVSLPPSESPWFWDNRLGREPGVMFAVMLET